ncbi:MAG: glycine--tRNA ligase subunit beta [Deltaproteobacteria bacterium]|nr:glycine--tRNA ligase subunit beta [Deltaproteobacteria bacterium]
MKSFLLEIQTEELPAGYIRPAVDALCADIIAKLDSNRIGHGQAKTYATPRRLAVGIENVAPRQEPLVVEVMGPPERVAYDAEGRPGVAAVKFAEKNGVDVKNLYVRETEKGRYVCAEKKEPALATTTVLKKLLPGVILSVPFPKTMRWSDRKIAFARPIHQIVALYGEKIVSFIAGGIKSGRKTAGHRFMHTGKISIKSPEDYIETLEAASVIPDFGKRKNLMEKRMEACVKSTNGTIMADEALCDTVTNLIEYPEPVLGRFDASFLALPEEILITAMREHQKYFAIRDKNGAMLPCFIAVNNTHARDMDVVTQGHERVLRARLEDARFFYETDMKTKFSDRVESLKKVLFQARLGTVYDKVARVEHICGSLCKMLLLDDDLTTDILRAARLCKADLVTHVVDEFPKLQGVMGRVYAGLCGENERVATAIEEHYRPISSKGVLPATLAGAIVSIADKVDTLCGCFHAGLIPSGAADPYALRRQSIGIIRIARQKDLSFSLSSLVSDALTLFYDGAGDGENDAARQVFDFLKNRMENLLEIDGIAKDLASAVLSASADSVPDVWKRAHALYKLKTAPDFEPIAVAFKRVVNIIKKAKPSDTAARLDPGLFSDKSEKDLFLMVNSLNKQVNQHVADGDIDAAFSVISSIRPAVDLFFDAVLVMDKDQNVRKNRLALLREISEMFARLVDFSRIST